MKCTVTELGGLGATYAVHLRLIGNLVGDFLLVIIELFSLGAFVLSHYTHLTDGQPTIARCDLTKLDAHIKQNVTYFWHIVTVSVESEVETTLGRILGD